MRQYTIVWTSYFDFKVGLEKMQYAIRWRDQTKNFWGKIREEFGWVKEYYTGPVIYFDSEQGARNYLAYLEREPKFEPIIKQR